MGVGFDPKAHALTDPRSVRITWKKFTESTRRETVPGAATRRNLIVDLAARFKLPAIYSFGFYAESGGLISYGIDQQEQARPAASYINQILRGANPGDLPVQLPLRYELIINLKTAAALGLTVPISLQLLADRVIE